MVNAECFELNAEFYLYVVFEKWNANNKTAKDKIKGVENCGYVAGFLRAGWCVIVYLCAWNMLLFYFSKTKRQTKEKMNLLKAARSLA